MAYTDRVVVLVDMDCFYCQVEENLNPAVKGKPLAVVQYNAWKGGGIIAVNYPARERGVTRHMRGDQAKQKCPEIELVQVPNVRGKADLTKYREAGKLVANVLQKFTPLIERASVDEAYLDITDAVKQRMEGATKELSLNDIRNTYTAGGDVMNFLFNLYNSGLCLESNLRLAFGAAIVEEIRSAVLLETGYTCSAGIAHNKILAKLASGLHKPNKQTILPQENISEVYKNLPVQKITSLGGKFGESLTDKLCITNMAELSKFSKKELTTYYDEKTANWLYDIARGINFDPVTTRMLAKSIACCKKFPGKSALVEPDSVVHWLNELALEIVERLDKDFDENNRKAKQLVVSFSQDTPQGETASSRTIVLRYYDVNKIVKDVLGIIKKNCLKSSGCYCIKFLGLSAGKFEDYKNVNEITSFFKIQPALDKSDDTGNYSDDTVDLNEDETNLNFFVETNHHLTQDNNASDSDSISNEILNTSNNSAQHDPSFFLNYIDNLKSKCESPVKRDFDTSRALDFSDDDSLDNHGSSENTKSNSSCVTEQSGTFSACKECKKKIAHIDMISHMDYHFALQMVREESKHYENDRPTQNKSNLGKMSKKRKNPELNKNSLIKFLQPNLKDNSPKTAEAVEICPHCNKNIEGAAFLSHLDYHAAKKLHMEINPASCSSINVVNTQTTKKPSKKRNFKESNTKSITKFFKPTS